MADVNDRLVVELSANVSKLLDGLKKASDAGAAWGDASAKQVQKVSAAFNGVQFEGATSKLKAEMLKQIELTHQLDVARTAGDAKTAAALQEQIALMQRIRQLRSSGLDAPTAHAAAGAQVAALAAAAAQARARREEEERAEQAARRREQVTGNPGAALQNVFSRSRIGVIEEGSAKIPIFGSALEELGAAGLVAAGGVLAASEAMEKAKEAAEYAEDIQNTADKLGITTKALQEYSFVALASGVSTDAMKEAIQGGNEALGAFQSNVGAGKIKPVFAALGITQEEALKAGNITNLLPEIAEKIQALGSTAEQSKIAEKLGLSAILPVLQKGKEGIEELTGEAERTGVVLDSSMIAKGKIAAEELKKAADVVDIDLKRAFIALAPLVEAVANKIAAVANYLGDAAESFAKLENQSSGYIQREMDREKKGNDVDGGVAQFFGAKKGADGRLSGGFAPGEVARYNAGLDHQEQMAAQLKANGLRDGISDLLKQGPAAKPLVSDKEKKGPADQTADFNKTAVDERDSAAKDLASAEAALTKNIQAHAEFEARAVDDDTAKKINDLSAQEAKIRQSKNDANKAGQLALIETAKTDTLNAAAAKKELIARNALQAQGEADLVDAARATGLEDRRRSAQASVNPSAQGRADADLQNFKDQQDAALEAERLRIANKAADNPNYTTGAADLADFRSTQNAELVAKRDQSERSANPLYALANPNTSVADELTGVEAKGVTSLADGLTSIITQTKSVQDAFRDMATSIITDLTRIGVQQYVTQPLANLLYGNQAGNLSNVGGSANIGLLGSLFGSASSTTSAATGTDGNDLTSAFADLDKAFPLITGFAGGTDNAPGGLAWVGESGKELVNLPGGSQVIPNDTLQALSRMTPANIGAGGPTTMNHNINIDLTGANGDETIKSIAYAAAAQGTAQAIASSRSDQARAQRSARQNLTQF